MYLTHAPDETIKHYTFNEMMEWLKYQHDNGETTRITLDGKCITNEVAEQLLIFWHDTYDREYWDYFLHPILYKYYNIGDEINDLTTAIIQNSTHIRQESMMSGGGL